MSTLSTLRFVGLVAMLSIVLILMYSFYSYLSVDITRLDTTTASETSRTVNLNPVIATFASSSQEDTTMTKRTDSQRSEIQCFADVFKSNITVSDAKNSDSWVRAVPCSAVDTDTIAQQLTQRIQQTRLQQQPPSTSRWDLFLQQTSWMFPKSNNNKNSITLRDLTSAFDLCSVVSHDDVVSASGGLFRRRHHSNIRNGRTIPYLCVSPLGGLEHEAVQTVALKTYFALELGTDYNVIARSILKQMSLQFPRCYVSASAAPVYVHPIFDYRINNVGHVVYRVFSTLMYLRRTYLKKQTNGDALDRLVVVLVITRPKDVDAALAHSRIEAFYRPLFGDRILTVVSDVGDGTAAESSLSGTRFLSQLASPTASSSSSPNATATMCFEEAHFGWDPTTYSGPTLMPGLRDVADDYVARAHRYYAIHPRPPRRNHLVRVTIVQRVASRRIRDLRAFVSRLLSAKHKNRHGADCTVELRVVHFERMSIVEQLRLLADTDILIGTTGAAMCLGAFLPRGAVLLELGTFVDYGATYAMDHLGAGDRSHNAALGRNHHVYINFGPASLAHDPAAAPSDRMRVDVTAPAARLLGAWCVALCTLWTDVPEPYYNLAVPFGLCQRMAFVVSVLGSNVSATSCEGYERLSSERRILALVRKIKTQPVLMAYYEAKQGGLYAPFL